jgi:Predicted membrane protein
MKNYLSFHLNGKQLFPYWISTYLLGIVLVVIYILRSKAIFNGDNSFETSVMLVLTFLLLVGVIYVYYYYVLKFTTDSIEYKEERLATSYTITQFLGTFIFGMFLSIITLGIYLPWFAQRLMVFFIEGSSYKGISYKFDGDGLTLFGIITLLLVVPIIALSIITAAFFGVGSSEEALLANVYQLVALAPLYTLLFKWMINGSYNGYRISLKVDFFRFMGFIFLHLLLTIITIGIYFPLFYLNIYKYVLSHVDCANAEGERVALDYDIDRKGDFLFIWGQLLLTIVTLGIYLPWAYTEVMRRVLSKTSLE